MSNKQTVTVHIGIGTTTNVSIERDDASVGEVIAAACNALGISEEEICDGGVLHRQVHAVGSDGNSRAIGSATESVEAGDTVLVDKRHANG